MFLLLHHFRFTGVSFSFWLNFMLDTNVIVLCMTKVFEIKVFSGSFFLDKLGFNMVVMLNRQKQLALKQLIYY